MLTALKNGNNKLVKEIPLHYQQSETKKMKQVLIA